MPPHFLLVYLSRAPEDGWGAPHQENIGTWEGTRSMESKGGGVLVLIAPHGPKIKEIEVERK